MYLVARIGVIGQPDNYGGKEDRLVTSLDGNLNTTGWGCRFKNCGNRTINGIWNDLSGPDNKRASLCQYTLKGKHSLH